MGREVGSEGFPRNTGDRGAFVPRIGQFFVWSFYIRPCHTRCLLGSDVTLALILARDIRRGKRGCDVLTRGDKHKCRAGGEQESGRLRCLFYYNNMGLSRVEAAPKIVWPQPTSVVEGHIPPQQCPSQIVIHN